MGVKTNGDDGPLQLMQFQKLIEQKCFTAGGGDLKAPAQRLTDFSNKIMSSSLPDCSYHPGLQPAQLNTILPPFVYQALAKGFVEFGKKMRGYFTNEAVVVATESRTSSPASREALMADRTASTIRPASARLTPALVAIFSASSD